MLRFRTKLELVFAIGMVTIMVIGGVWAATRTITSSSDNVSTLIVCSNGNYYDASFANFVTALGTLSSTGGWIELPVCNLSLTSTIVMTSNITLRGAGKDATIFFLPSSGNKDMMYINSKHDILIEDIGFNMNNGSQTAHASYRIIDITSSSASVTSNNITINRCSFKNGLCAPMIDIQEYCEQITVSNCVFDKREWYTGGYGGAIWCSTHSCKFLYNYIQDTWSTGIVVEANTSYIPGKYNLIQGNELTGVIGIALYLEGETAGSPNTAKGTNSTITGNFIHDLHTCNAYGQITGIITSSNSTITNNVICDIESTSASNGINIGESTYNTVICNNVIRECYRGIFSQENNTVNSGITTISGNSIWYCTEAGIGLKQGQWFSICDNVIYLDSTDGDGIMLTCCNDGTVSNNFVISTDTTPSSSKGVYINDCTDIVVNSNVFKYMNWGVYGSGDYIITVGNNARNCDYDVVITGSGNVNEHNIT